MNNWSPLIAGNVYVYGYENEPNTVHVSLNGVDSPNYSGNVVEPFRTLAYACTRMQTVGGKIRLGEGTFVETVQSELAPGVSVVGAGRDLTFVQGNNAGVGWRILNLESAGEATPGNQEISGITFDGIALTAYWGIYVIRRSNVKIHHCRFIDILQTAVLFKGSAGAGEAGDYSEDNEFSDNNESSDVIAMDASYITERLKPKF